MPLLTAANWGGQGLHARGNFEGFTRAASAHKWLEVHGLEHWTHFYTDYGVGLQKRFFACFLHGDDARWRDQPAVQLQVRTLDGFVQRAEREWPLARTRWTRLYLRPDNSELGPAPPGAGGGARYPPAPRPVRAGRCQACQGMTAASPASNWRRAVCSSLITCMTALIRARWVKAWGKLPMCRPDRGSISSAYSNSGLA